MQVISLNTWGGRAGHAEFLSFFERNKTTDIFCLQEVWRAPYPHLEGRMAGGVALDNAKTMTDALLRIAEILPEHDFFFHPHVGENYGLAMFVKKSMEVLESGEVFVHKHKEFVPEGDVGLHARNVQYVTVTYGGRPFSVLNFHGLWNGQGKSDTPDRLEQSKRIVDFTKKLSGPFVLCGDFNLLPETESLRMLENAGMRNLVREYGITSTRSPLYTKPEKYADYMLASGVDVVSFEVLPDVVSDHMALRAVVR